MDAILKEIEKKFSKTNPDIIFDSNKTYEVVSSGDIMFDLLTGIGGFPKGRIVEVIGFESSGKSSLLYSSIGAAQKRGMVCALLDAEMCFDPWYAESCYNLKLDNKTFFLFQPTCIEEADTIMDMLMESSTDFDMICTDSIACLTPRAIQDGSLEDNQGIGLHARKVSQFVHKMKRYCYLRNFAAVLTNQMKFQIQRDQWSPGVGVATGLTYKDQYTTPGGMTPRFLASIRVKMETKGRQTEANAIDPITGEVSDMKNTKIIKYVNLKNKCSRPELISESFFDLPTPTQKGGFNAGKNILELLRKRGRITQSGATFKYQGLSKEWTFRGKANGEAAFLNTPEIIADAFALFDKLREEDTTKTLLVDKAVLGEDISEGERRAQKEEIPDDTVRIERPAKSMPSGDTTL